MAVVPHQLTTHPADKSSWWEPPLPFHALTSTKLVSKVYTSQQTRQNIHASACQDKQGKSLLRTPSHMLLFSHCSFFWQEMGKVAHLKAPEIKGLQPQLELWAHVHWGSLLLNLKLQLNMKSHISRHCLRAVLLPQTLLCADGKPAAISISDAWKSPER